MFGDRALIGELILNLADNAIKYSPAGSVITIGVRVEEGAMRLILEDDGPGIREEDHQVVFERFVRLQNLPAEGCGLGLAIVREIASRHGAKVTLGEAQEGGLRVEVVFPTHKGEGA
jgi:two-component system sensor histidine kinase TctE